ncbi:MAG: hypothetical protein LBR60_08620, partial [Fibrobacter sp.]|nr:hypothetical protein [Fibrobacter sp.]
WETAKKLAPKDWRLPTVDDWNNLIQYVGGWRNAGQKLKSDGSNSSGFSAIEGHYPEIGLALKKSICGYSWWSMERDNTLAFIQFFDCDDVFQTYQDKSLHCSVRYVQDQHDSFGTKVKGEHAVVLNGLHIY